MSNIIQSPGSPGLIEAIDANLSEEMAYFGRGLPHGELHETPELLWFFTGQSGPNGVLRTRLASDTREYVEAKIAQIISFFKARQASFDWSIGPTTRPANFAAFLQARGFTYDNYSTGMAVDLLSINEDIPVNRELVITEIEDSETLKILRSIEIKGFGSSPETAQKYYATYISAGFGTGKPWHHYLGWLHGEPVAMASLLFHAGVAGIYGVATTPEARRQGAGAAMTLHTLHQAREQGYRVAVLTPTDMSIAIYRRLGFQEYCKIHHYTWSPGP